VRAVLLAAVLACSGCNQLLGIEPLHLGDDDGGTTPGDAPFVYGATHLFSYSIGVEPTTAVALTTNIDTDNEAACDARIAAQCVIAGSTITIGSGVTVRVTGSRPLALVAADTIEIAGILDASSTIAGQVGAGSQPTGSCLGQMAASASNNNGGGGAGGSFGAAGANGGGGNNNNGTPGKVGTAEVPVTTIRGGCKGGDGAAGSAAAAPGGVGGGAVVLVAVNTIHVGSSGRIFASGAGGKGGLNQAGGGGGGSGGMIGLDAPTLTIEGRIAADGGAGGEGSTNNSTEHDGQDGATENVDTPALGGAGGSVNAGDGGSGATGGNLPTAGMTANNGGGGGGGGLGVFWTHGAITGTVFSPSPTPIP